MRRCFDVTCALAGLLILSPLFVLIAAAVILEDGGPIFYSQRRIGRDFLPFVLYKFRSMLPDAERLGRPLTEAQDSRITDSGRFLRRYKLDELPQLINVLKGDMQLVGARPEVERYVRLFPSEYAQILRDRPGITDPASIAFRHEEECFSGGDIEAQYVASILPAKLQLSLEYARRRSFWSDVRLIFQTLLGSAPMPFRRTEPQS